MRFRYTGRWGGVLLLIRRYSPCRNNSLLLSLSFQCLRVAIAHHRFSLPILPSERAKHSLGKLGERRPWGTNHRLMEWRIGTRRATSKRWETWFKLEEEEEEEENY